MRRRSCYGQFMHRLAIAIPGLLLLGACTANTSTYPSLARRPAERITGTAEPATAVTEPNPELPSAETTDRIAALVAQAQAADAKFVTGQAEARRLVEAASDAEVDSTAWSNATVALASLASARSDAEVALADLDRLYAEARLAGKPGEAIAQAQASVQQLVTRQNTVIGELEDRMPMPASTSETAQTRPPAESAPAP